MTQTLTEQILNGHRRAIARCITHLENGHPEGLQVLEQLYPHTGQAHLVGVTGAPGTGKSSLVTKLAKTYREQGQTVAILAIDPTSPFSGGAILGDRIRMLELTGDAGVFIRSMASRGSLGGLARAAADAIKVLDAAGFEVILIETVGAGQSEVEIVKAAHTVIVVEAPGLGDDVQAIKAGILEIADIFVVNKADRPGAERTAAALKAMLELGHPPAHHMLHHGILRSLPETPPYAATSDWQVPVLPTVALDGSGVSAVVQAIADHRQQLNHSGELADRNRTRLIDELEIILQMALMKRIADRLPAGTLADIVDRLADRTLSPHAAAEAILAAVKN